MLLQRLAKVILMVATILCMAPANCEQPGSEVKCTPDCIPEPVPPPPVMYPPPPECPPPPPPASPPPPPPEMPPPPPPVLPPPSPPVEPPVTEKCPPPPSDQYSPPSEPFTPPSTPFVIFGPPGELYPVDPNHRPSSSRRNLAEALPVYVAGGLVLLALWSTH